MNTKVSSPVSTSSNSHSSKPFFNRSGEGSSFFSSKDAESSFFNSSFIQPKLAIGQPNDKYEQEADAIADNVVQKISSSKSTPTIQTKCEACEHEEKLQKSKKEDGEVEINRKAIFESSDDIPGGQIQTMSSNPGHYSTPSLESQLRTSKGMGSPISKDAKDEMEFSLGADFSPVKIHTDANSIQMNQELNARAFTQGSDIFFNQGEYSPHTTEGKKLLAHELTHVVQQTGAHAGGASQSSSPLISSKQEESNLIQRAGDPAAIPTGFACPPDHSTGAPAGTGILFNTSKNSTISPAHTTLLTTFRNNWLASRGTDNILVHGYASPEGDQGDNWTLSCKRALATRSELIRLGIPSHRITFVAHGASTDFGSSRAPNRRAVVSSIPGGLAFPLLIFGDLTPNDNFTGRSFSKYGVGEEIDLDFFSFPAVPASHFGGLEWHIASGGGTFTAGSVTQLGTATYNAPAAAATVTLELRVATGVHAGDVMVSRTIEILEPSAVNMTATTFPNVSPSGGTIPVGTWGAGMLANVFVDPKEVSFKGVIFGEGVASGVVTPAGGFQAHNAGIVHTANTFGPGHGGNATTGTPVSPPQDQIATQEPPTGTFFGLPTCGNGQFLWAIPWEFQVPGNPRVPFPGGFTANHLETFTFFCDATIEKAGAGPFCRSIDGTPC